jgi:hypothetical protein
LQACDQWHSSRASTFFSVHTVKSLTQTLKAADKTYAARINLLWAPSLDNVAVSGYLVYRAVAGGQHSLVGNITHASFRDAFQYTPPAALGNITVTYLVHGARF